MGDIEKAQDAGGNCPQRQVHCEGHGDRVNLESETKDVNSGPGAASTPAPSIPASVRGQLGKLALDPRPWEWARGGPEPEVQTSPFSAWAAAASKAGCLRRVEKFPVLHGLRLEDKMFLLV